MTVKVAYNGDWKVLDNMIPDCQFLLRNALKTRAVVCDRVSIITYTNEAHRRFKNVYIGRIVRISLDLYDLFL